MLRVLMKHATALLVLNYPDTYVFKSWHGTLFTLAILSLSVTFNTFFAQKLHLVVSTFGKDSCSRYFAEPTLGNRCLSSACSRLLRHPYHTLGTRRESSIRTSVDNLLRSWMGQSRTFMPDWYRCQYLLFAWSGRSR
jgi:hypothetical protein